MGSKGSGALLLALGGTLVVLGSFLPEARVLVANALHPASRVPPPDRSHLVVFLEDTDMLADPDPDLDAWFYVFYACEAGGLAYLAVAGALAALSAAAPQSRALAIAFGAAHAASFLALAVGATVVHASAPAGAAWGATSRMVFWGSFALFALFLAQATATLRALRRGRGGRLAVVDAANVVPLVFVTLLDGALFVALARHPNWPAGGYLVAAVGGALAVAGMLLRARRAGPAAASA